MQNVTLDVKGMTCAHCQSSVEKSLENLKGVKNVEVNLDTGKVNVTYDDVKVTVDDMREAVEDQGYDVMA